MYGVRSKKIVSIKHTQYKALLVRSCHKSQKSKIRQTQSKMADQALMSEAIVKAIAEVTRIAIQTMVETQTQISESQ